MAFLTMSMYSEILQMDTNVNVLLPEKRKSGVDTLDTDKKYPVIYLLHGHGDDHWAWIRKSNIELIARDYDVIVVMPTTYRGFYVDNYEGLNYFQYLSEELPTKMANFFHVTLDPKQTFVAGNSMGGYGALRWAMEYPEKFAAAASLSGALMPYGKAENAEYTCKKVFNNEFLENQIRALGEKEYFIQSKNNLCNLARDLSKKQFSTRFYICCGEDDFLTYEQYKMFKEKLEEENINLPITWDTSKGGHDWKYWNPKIQDIFDFFGLEKRKEK